MYAVRPSPRCPFNHRALECPPSPPRHRTDRIRAPARCLALDVYARTLPILGQIPHNAETQPERVTQTLSPQAADVLCASEDRDGWHRAVFRTVPPARVDPTKKSAEADSSFLGTAPLRTIVER
jgi:hypothetical protein